MSKKSDVPVLSDVVKRGDEDIIKAARLEREIFDELNRMAPHASSKYDSIRPATPSGSLEVEIDRIVTKHSQAMRCELLQLLRDKSQQRPREPDQSK